MTDELFSNAQWRVTSFGLETTAGQPRYEVAKGSLTETTDREDGTFYDWPVHMAEKDWVDLSAFAEAFAHALDKHVGAYSPPADNDLLERSLWKAERIRRSA